MADANVGQCCVMPIYILGKKLNIKQCLKLLTGEEKQCKGMWTVHSGIDLNSDNDLMMAKLKEHALGMDYKRDEQDMDTCSSSQDFGKRHYQVSLNQNRPAMKRLKSWTRGHNEDIGYESDHTECETELRVDIHTLVTDDTDLNRIIAPFAIQLFQFPALFIVPVGSESSRKDLYAQVVKELGIYIEMRQEDTSKILVVNMTEEEHGKNTVINWIQFSTFHTKLGSHLTLCRIDELLKKVQLFLRDTENISRRNTGCQSVEKIFQEKTRDSIFIEKTNVGITNDLEELIKKKCIICIKAGNGEFICKPDELVSEFLTVLHGILPVSYECGFLHFLTSIKEPVERQTFVDAFIESDLIELDLEKEKCYILPLLSCEGLQDYEEKDFTVKTNALRLTVNVGNVPTVTKSKILYRVVNQGWSLKSCGPNLFGIGTKDSYLFVKNSLGLIAQYHASKGGVFCIFLCALQFSDYGNCNGIVEVNNKDFEILEQNVESELHECYDKYDTKTNRFPIIEKHVLQGSQCNTETVNKDWTVVNLQHEQQTKNLDEIELLRPWFASKADEIEKRMNLELHDNVLLDIAELFGYGYKLFFVSLGIPNNSLDQIEMDSRRTRDCVFQMLVAWRKHYGQKASVATLRSAIKRSSHVNVNLNDFDNIVEKHRPKDIRHEGSLPADLAKVLYDRHSIRP